MRVCVCVCLWMDTHSSPSTMYVGIYKVYTKIIFPQHSAKVPIDPLQRGTEEKKRKRKNKQSLFTLAKTSSDGPE